MSTELAPTAGTFSGDPWARQPGESDRSYQAFTIYRDLGATRSLPQAEIAYRELHGLAPKDPKKMPSSQFGDWSRVFNWVERCSAYDDHQDRVELAIHRRERVRAATRHAKRAAKAEAMLARPMELYLERMEQTLAGERPDGLAELSDEELIRLGRYTLGLMFDAQKAEREALGSTDDTPSTKPQTVLRGTILRQILGNRDAGDALEAVAFQLSESTEEVKPVTSVTGQVLPEPELPQDNEKDPR